MIEPTSVTLASGQKQHFFSDGTHWIFSPSLGELADGTYTAPKPIFISKTVLVTAKDPSDPAKGGTAVVTLSSTPFWMGVIAVFWCLLLPLLAAVFFRSWPGPIPEVTLTVNPPAVTLGKNQIQQFTAALAGAPEQDVTWSASAGAITPTGLYSAPAVTAEQTAAVTATRNSDRSRTSTAIVVLSPDFGLTLNPPFPQVKPSNIVKFTVPENRNVQWQSLAPEDGKLTDGGYTAPNRIDHRKVVTVTAVDTEKPTHLASARIFLLPDGVGSPQGSSIPTGGQFLWLALVAGAIGSSLGAVRSFVNYVGSRHFVPSWGFYYLLHPTFGAGLALLVHMGHRMGAVGASSTANDPAVVGFYSGLVGLFSDVALQKLRDIVGTIFGVQDQRTDKLPSGVSGPAAATPAIAGITASAATGLLTIEGQHFSSGAVVSVNGAARTTTFVSDKKLEAKLDPAVDTAGKKVAVMVKNPDGKESGAFSVTL